MHMNKIATIAASALLVTTLAGCANNNSQQQNQAQNQQAQDARTFNDAGQKETGNGSFYIKTETATSENGQTPEVKANESGVANIQIIADGFDQGKGTFIFIDGKQVNDAQNFVQANITLTLKGDQMKSGAHKICLVQFDNNRTDGKVTTFKQAQYSIA